jgi:PadR family transcriptional regulator
MNRKKVERYSSQQKLNKLKRPIQKRQLGQVTRVTEKFEKSIVQRLTRSLLDIQILRLLRINPMWGYKIKKTAETQFNIKLRHGALYPTLNYLENEGYVTVEKQEAGGRARKVYTLTRKGKDYLDDYYQVIKEQLEDADLVGH